MYFFSCAGPKYLLKLQQEFHASRVLIIMDRHGDLDKAGGDQQSSIRKYLTEIKDDSAISMTSVRCRELDSLRAYYYLAVLDYLRENMPGSQSENDSLDGMPNGKLVSAAQKMTNGDVDEKCVAKRVNGEASLLESVSQAQAPRRDSEQNMSELDQNGKLSHSESGLTHSQNLMDNGEGVGKDCDKRQASQVISDRSLAVDAGVKKPLLLFQELSSCPLISSTMPVLSSPESSSVDPPPSVPFSQHLQIQPAANDSGSVGDKSSVNPPSLPAKSAVGSSGSTARKSYKASKDNMVRGDLDYSTLLKLSKGILWDVQAKREALTETLGYVHQAISQHLLFNRSSSDHLHEPGSKDPSSVINSNSSNIQQTVNSDHVEDGGCSRTRLVLNSPIHESSGASDSYQRNITNGGSTETLPPWSSSSSIASQTVLFTEAPRSDIVRSVTENLSTYQKAEQELLGPLKSESEDLQKPRKASHICFIVG